MAKTVKELEWKFKTFSILTISIKSIRTKILKLLPAKRAHEQAGVLNKRTGKLRDLVKFIKKGKN